MLIRIIHNPRLIDGEIIDNGIEEINTTKPISISKINQYKNLSDKEAKPCLYLQIGNFLEKDFQERILFNDEIYIEETDVKFND